MKTKIMLITFLLWTGVAGAAPFNPSRYETVTATNHPAVGYLAWHVDLDNDHLVATGKGPMNQNSAFVLKRHLGGADKWNVVAAFEGLQVEPDRMKVAVAGDVAVVADRNDDTVATNAGAVHILMRNHPNSDAWGWWKTLYPTTPVAGGYFGANVATDGRYVAVASSTTNGVYLFARNAGGADQWGLVKSFASAVTNDSANLSVALEGDLLAVGDFWDRSNQVVRLHERNVGGADQWGLLRNVTPAEGQSTNDFGYSVALQGRLLAVGARRDANDDGAVYLFERDQGGTNNWGQVAKRQPDPGLGGWLGSSVAVRGDTVVVAAPYESGLNPPDGGALYVFQRNAGGSNAWGRTARLLADADAYFLGSTRPGGLALKGDTLVAGNYWQTSLPGTPSVRVFSEYACPDWALLKRVVETSAGTNSEFGLALTFDDSFLVAGRPGRTSGGATQSGGVVNYARNAGGPDNWGNLSALGSSITNHRSGSAMALSPKLVVAGAPGGSGSGSINIMSIDNSGAEYFSSAQFSPDNQPGEQFGAAVAIWDDTILVGSPLNNVAGTAAGAAFIFGRNADGSNSWEVVKRLAPSPLPATAEFGRSAALYRDIAVVGAPYEDDFVNGLGAVYVFQANRGGSNNWGQAKRIKVPDVAGAPYLGWSVALWGDVLAVGAVGDDEGALDSGAVYLFERNRGGADNWGLIKKVKPPTPQDTAGFGWSVALRGDRLVVGEPRRDVDFLDQGRAFVFERNQDGSDQWGLVTRIDSTVPQTQAWFGASVALIDDRIAVGAPYEDIGTATNAGAIYLFRPDCLRITTTNDVVSSSDGLTSLREAINLANASTQSQFTVYIPDGVFISTNASWFTISNKTSKIILQGQGARRTAIDKTGAGRVFQLNSGTTGEVRDLTIRNGRAADGMDGMGSTNGVSGGHGGGLITYGDWRLVRCTIVSNTAGNGGGAQAAQGTQVGAGGLGGGIYVYEGTLVIRDCTISHNRAGDAGASGDVGNDGGRGGGIYIRSGAEVEILNSTVFGNSSGQGSATNSDGNGGGISSFAAVTIRHSTISHNSAGSGPNRGAGGGIASTEPVTMRFSILNNNSGASGFPDAAATFASPAYNLISNTNGVTFTGTPVSNIVGVLAMLGGAEVVNNGGPTDTMMPQPGSPVIDKGDASLANLIATDQRGFPRPTNGSSIDLGAVETTPDFDGDGVPDAWEQGRRTDFEEPADSAADLDGDGFNGYAEYVMDTNPYGSAPFEIINLVQTSDVTRITVQTSTARLYSVQATVNLTSTAWNALSGLQDIPGTGGNQTFIRTNAIPVRNFRVDVRLP